jgi:2-dehydro-3-deoxygluconokinase
VTRVVTFGELLLRLSPPAGERFLQSPELRAGFGGAEANVAVSLAHFGTASDYVTALPLNPLGDAALRALRAEGVGVGHVVRDGARLGIYFVEPGAELRPMRVVYDRAGSAASQVDAATFDWPRILDGAAWFHWTGITPALGEGPARCTAAAVRAARAAGATVSVDLNYRPALWAGRDPARIMCELVPMADVLIGNLGAAEAMLGVRAAEGTSADDAAREVAASLAASFGSRVVALTRREHLSASEHGWSATLLDGESGAFLASPRYQLRLVDRVGGGDSFAAALVHALLARQAPQAALDFAVAASALKLTIVGDFNRVTADEVDQAAAEARGQVRR